LVRSGIKFYLDIKLQLEITCFTITMSYIRKAFYHIYCNMYEVLLYLYNTYNQKSHINFKNII